MPKLLLSENLSIEKKKAQGLTVSNLHKLVLQIVPSLLEILDEVPPVYIYTSLFVLLSKRKLGYILYAGNGW